MRLWFRNLIVSAMPLSRANSITALGAVGVREALFQTLMSPKGSRPQSPSFSPSAGSPRPRRNLATASCAVHALVGTTSIILLFLTALMYLPDSEIYDMKKLGCQPKLLELNDRINATLLVGSDPYLDGVEANMYTHCYALDSYT